MRLRRPAFFLFFLLLINGCRSRDTRKLVLYTDTPESLTLELARRFEEKHGIKVEAVMEGTSWLMTRLRAEQGRPIADVFMGASGTVPAMVLAREGILSAYTPLGLETMPTQEGPLWLRDPQWRWVGFGFASLGLVYDRHEIPKGELPEHWDELADAKWKQGLTIWDPSVSGTATSFLVASLWRLISAGRGEEGGWAFLEAFHQNLKKYAEEGPPAFLVAHGVVRLGLHLDNQFLYYRRKVKENREKLSFYLPRPVFVFTDPVGLVADAPHPDEGKLFIDFLHSPEAQAILSSTFWVKDDRGRIILPPEHPYSDSRQLVNSALVMNFEWMAENFDRARIYWQNHVEE
ncbi:MAG: extracellular solute-binding protein [Elusimicrobia bacterium]|nr:extracellular solute-binding protein [Elusimicrobiota bacterium]